MSISNLPRVLRLFQRYVSTDSGLWQTFLYPFKNYGGYGIAFTGQQVQTWMEAGLLCLVANGDYFEIAPAGSFHLRQAVPTDFPEKSCIEGFLFYCEKAARHILDEYER